MGTLSAGRGNLPARLHGPVPGAAGRPARRRCGHRRGAAQALPRLHIYTVAGVVKSGTSRTACRRAPGTIYKDRLLHIPIMVTSRLRTACAPRPRACWPRRAKDRLYEIPPLRDEDVGNWGRTTATASTSASTAWWATRPTRSARAGASRTTAGRGGIRARRRPPAARVHPLQYCGAAGGRRRARARDDAPAPVIGHARGSSRTISRAWRTTAARCGCARRRRRRGGACHYRRDSAWSIPRSSTRGHATCSPSSGRVPDHRARRRAVRIVVTCTGRTASSRPRPGDPH